MLCLWYWTDAYNSVDALLIMSVLAHTYEIKSEERKIFLDSTKRLKDVVSVNWNCNQNGKTTEKLYVVNVS